MRGNGNSNSRGGPALATDVHRDDNGNGNVWGDLAPYLGKETLYGMDTAAGGAADNVEQCHK